MAHDETPINSGERRRRLPVVAESAGLWLEEHLVWPAGDALGALRKHLRHGIEWATWVVRRGVIWPLQDRGESAGAPARALAAVAAVLVVAVGVAAAIGVTSGSDGEAPASSQVAVTTTTSEPAASEQSERPTREVEPTLEGAAPNFEPTAEERKTETAQEPASAAPSVPQDVDAATATIGTKPDSASSSAASSSTAQSAIGVDGPPAGPEALAVAEDFAGAFVLYETGGEESKVRKAFAATATPELAKSLLRRPPRLPANVEVPQAKVVNVVAGPSHGGVYSVSVSLLRVGLTSELRLDMEKQKQDWLVTNVLG